MYKKFALEHLNFAFSKLYHSPPFLASPSLINLVYNIAQSHPENGRPQFVFKSDTIF